MAATIYLLLDRAWVVPTFILTNISITDHIAAHSITHNIHLSEKSTVLSIQRDHNDHNMSYISLYNFALVMIIL